MRRLSCSYPEEQDCLLECPAEEPGHEDSQDGGQREKGERRGDRKDAVTVANVAAAMDYVCQLAGDAQHVALGTDFDGGFGAESTPAEIDTIADLPKVATALKTRGYADVDVEAILGGNWLRILRRALP